MGRLEVILLDTHVVVWLAFDRDRLSNTARSAIARARKNSVALAVSDMTLLELATLGRKNRLQLGISVESFLQAVETRFAVRPMNAKICARAMDLLDIFPKDPADRIIAATALVEGLALITADREMRKSKFMQTVW
jgi:PIN domain nuclease of toxin-antitoxin system